MKHQNLIEKMTIEEKAAFLSGKNEWQSRDIPRLGIPSIAFADGPHGVRRQAGAGDHLGLNPSLPATCFPTAAMIANSWDETLGREIGEALGEEARAQGVHVLLGPGLNIKRSPLCGRNFEYFSEDPYLAGKMAASYIRGIQRKGVYACPKHFAVNSRELRRMAMNAVLDERTLREIYLTGFEIAVKEGGAKAIMTSYNEVNGIYANENSHLLREILREDWGFDGIVITDWGGSNDHVKGVEAGSDLEMPTPGLDSARQLLRAIESNMLSVEKLDECVDNLLDAVLTLTGESKERGENVGNEKSRNITFSKTAHHELARKAASQSAVLLKNTDHILPLAPGSKVAIIGDFAYESRYQGAGSSMVNPTFVETVRQVISNYDLQVVGFSRGYRRFGEAEESLKKEALNLAEEADVVLYFFGLDELSEIEGMDREHLRLPVAQTELLRALALRNENVVGVLSAGSAIEMPWRYCCKAILHGYLGGQAGASAMMDILTGKTNPSGRLAESFPIRNEETPAYRYFHGTGRNSEYREGLFVGYRYYDTAEVEVQYPFGYGLSYTAFEYRDIRVDESGVDFTLENIGEYDGAEVAQLYVGLPESEIFRPVKELKGFKKVFLKAGESRRVRLSFDDKTFRYWNIKTGQWEIETGSYRIGIGASVADIRLEASLDIKGVEAVLPYDLEKLPSYVSGKIQQIEDSEFETLLGGEIPCEKPDGVIQINDAICQMRFAKSFLARFIFRCLDRIRKRNEAKGKPDLNILFICNMPFRAIAKMTGGAVSMDMVQGIVLAVNGHFLRGMKRLIVGFFVNAKENKKYEQMLAREENG